MAAVPTGDGVALHTLPLMRLRALLAQALGDDVGYRHMPTTIAAGRRDGLTGRGH